MALNSYKDLNVWQQSRELTKEVYELCKKLPKDEIIGICSQMKRSSVSIPSNIAEGYRRNNRKEYIQFIGIASGSAAELETQLILVQDIFAIKTDGMIDKLNQIQKMLLSLRKKLDPKP